jgi:hypothetical protein
MRFYKVTFQPGIVSNPNGRPKGSKNKLAREFQQACALADEKYPHPYLMMAEWANDENKPLEIRAAMLKECASYRCVKPKQSIAIQHDVPTFESAEQAEQFLAEFISAMAPELEPEQIATMTRQFILSKRGGKELELKVANQGNLSQPQKIEIIGGLPRMPGHEHLLMPHQMNGQGQGPIIEHREIQTQEQTSGKELSTTEDSEP